MVLAVVALAGALVAAAAILLVCLAVFTYVMHRNYEESRRAAVKQNLEELRPAVIPAEQGGDLKQWPKMREVTEADVQEAWKELQRDMEDYRQSGLLEDLNKPAADAAAADGKVPPTREQLLERLREICKVEKDRNDRSKELSRRTDEVQRATEEMARFKEEREKFREERRKLALKDDPDALTDPPPKLSGLVRDVSIDDLVEISLGEDDGLRPGHQLEVTRVVDGALFYVGRVEVVKTWSDKSVCKNRPGKANRVQKGDRVDTKQL